MSGKWFYRSNFHWGILGGEFCRDTKTGYIYELFEINHENIKPYFALIWTRKTTGLNCNWLLRGTSAPHKLRTRETILVSVITDMMSLMDIFYAVVFFCFIVSLCLNFILFALRHEYFGGSRLSSEFREIKMPPNILFYYLPAKLKCLKISFSSKTRN